MAEAYSVSRVNHYIKNMFKTDFVLNKISVKGEISNCKYHSTGHVYFTLKDEGGTLACVMFASYAAGLDFRVREGMQVVVTGRIDVYEKDGKYQLYAVKVEQDGTGDLFRRFQELRDQLEEMGMFAPEYKKPIPRFATRIGIVTAPTGAAIRDIQNIASRRNPYVQLYLMPALVQGEGARNSLTEAIRRLDKMNMDVMIVGRGGGSIEDLWAFNEEEVARAIFACETPVISAVGHEIDFTIADFVADMRAPTPSAAAELAVFDYAAWERQLALTSNRLYQGAVRVLERSQSRLKQMSIRLQYRNPQHLLDEKRMQLIRCEERLDHGMRQAIKEKKHLLALAAQRLEGVSPLRKLAMGYSYVSNGQGENIRSISQIQKGDKLEIYVSDGRIEAVAEETKEMQKASLP